MHRLPGRSELAGHLRLWNTVAHLQNGAIPMLGHPVRGTVWLLVITHKTSIKPDGDQTSRAGL